jgi:predicted ATPase
LVRLVERAGLVVSKTDLIAAVWPDVTVDEGALRVHISAVRKALGDGAIGTRHVMTVPGRGYCFVTPISRLSEPALVGSAGSIPPRLTRMVGRDETTREVSAQLSAHRFVSIVGPGGIGKTTVAVAAGHMLLAESEPVCFLDLGPLNDAVLVPGAVASALGLLVQSSDPTAAIIRFLRNKRMFLILDSCEHVIEAAAVLAERIFQEAPQVCILATSRETLRVEGEHVHRLKPLDSPPDAPGLTAAQVLKFPAAQLFVERAAASDQAFQLEDRDAAAVGEICRRLDGIPLAIELAAGRVHAHGVQEIAALLDHRFRLLWEGRRTAMPRHQTLSAALDWSYDLLRDSEATILCRLSVFARAFTIEAAVAVAGDTNIDRKQIDAVLESLVAKSLVTADISHPTTRYRLLDTTRMYVLAKLMEIGDADMTKHRNASRRVT